MKGIRQLLKENADEELCLQTVTSIWYCRRARIRLRRFGRRLTADHGAGAAKRLDQRSIRHTERGSNQCVGHRVSAWCYRERHEPHRIHAANCVASGD